MKEAAARRLTADGGGGVRLVADAGRAGRSTVSAA
jgi:hypothetical protein